MTLDIVGGFKTSVTGLEIYFTLLLACFFFLSESSSTVMPMCVVVVFFLSFAVLASLYNYQWPVQKLVWEIRLIVDTKQLQYT